MFFGRSYLYLRGSALLAGLGLPLALALVAVRGAAPAGQSSAAHDPRPIEGAFFEASGIVAVPGTSGALFVDDGRGRHVWWMEFDGTGRQRGKTKSVSLGVDVSDPEDIASDGEHFYVVGSQSKAESRVTLGLVRFTFDVSRHRAEQVEGIRDLKGFLQSRLPELSGTGRGGVRVLNIEGLAWDAARGRLLLGLRAPTTLAGALVVGLKLRDPRGTFTADNVVVDTPAVLRVPISGGIRGLGYDASSKRVLVLAGAADDLDVDAFRLYGWDGRSGSAPGLITTLDTRLKPEGVTRILVGGRVRTLIVCDSSRYLFLD